MSWLKTTIYDGYCNISVLKTSKKRLKLRVVANNHTLNYDIEKEITIPFQLGDGRYDIVLYQNVIGNRYTQLERKIITVRLKDKFSPYLHSNQYVDYTATSPWVVKATELCAEATTNEEKIEKIRNYIAKNFAYNYVKAITVRNQSLLPDIDDCFNKKLGICQDFAALMVSMLRSQNIPAALIIGMADSKYHAWVRVYINNDIIYYDPTADIQHKKVKKYTIERWY